MSIFLGIDVGTVSVKIALVSDQNSHKILQGASKSEDLFYRPSYQEKINEKISSNVLVTKYHRLKGSPVRGTYRFLKRIMEIIPAGEIKGARVCGSGGRLIGEILGINYENEFRAVAHGAGVLYPDICTIFEMGGQNSKYISLERDAETGEVGITDYEKSGDCAAGTGSFLDQHAGSFSHSRRGSSRSERGQTASASAGGGSKFSRRGSVKRDG
jgi:activator of 2-hydroxyglutaryl-CoA dehydratase